ncbi:MAG TPA: hydrogenase formation protein HypD [Solirubrobacteraceae bacterium]|nr:hydrogenase formation protein HypD [Solirubrobacteraceae bacterium]
MRFAHEFRDPRLGRTLAREIAALAARARSRTSSGAGSGESSERALKVMEICGGHTHTIYRYAIDELLPEGVEFVHGPGCPVCVLPMGRVDDAIELARRPEVTLACFGDMMRVPGSEGSLLEAKAGGADVRMVYSPLDALKLAKSKPEREVVFLAIGFETTAPSTALTLRKARAEGVRNFSCMCNHVTIEPPLRALLDSPELELDGFVGPGHVSTVVGLQPFRFIPEEYGKPVVVSGFEPVDVLQSIEMLLRQLAEGRCEVENQYRRVAASEGNWVAVAAMEEVFTLRERFEWRGLGTIEASGLAINEEYGELDAERRFGVRGARVEDPQACQCGEVLKGVIKPWECRVFGTACTPERPIGTCMVSPEGACAAYYNYGRHTRVGA